MVTGLSVFSFPKLFPSIVISVPPYTEPTDGEIAETDDPMFKVWASISMRP